MYKNVNLFIVLVFLVFVLFATAGCENSSPVKTQVVYVPIQPPQAADSTPYQQPQLIYVPQPQPPVVVQQSPPVIIQQPQQPVLVQPQHTPHHPPPEIRIPREVPCATCGGMGKIICSTCGGTGYQNTTCGNCQGTGKTLLKNVCPLCDGTGKPRCPGCYSWPTRGYQKCGTCGGTGRIRMP